MVEKYQSIMKNDVCEIVPRTEENSVVTSRWLYKIKHGADGSIEKQKARFVARALSPKEGVDYDETFAHVAQNTSIRTIIAIALAMGWKLHQMDVKTAFLNDIIKKEAYIEQPKGFIVHEKDSHVCRLKKELYGLKKEPCAQYGRIDIFLLSMGSPRVMQTATFTTRL